MSIAANLEQIRRRIVDACRRSGRSPQEVTILAVGKGRAPESIREAAQCGLASFGESKVQELKQKAAQCPGHLRWDFVGHLQTNKCREAARIAQMIHSVDSERVAQSLNNACEKLAKTIPVLLEVNVSGEANKYGFRPDEALEKLRILNALDRLEIHGFMTMAPWSKEAENARPHFRRLKQFQKEAEEILGAPLPELSMGMSDDFEVAVEEGATIIRIGNALFGKHRQTT